MSSEDLQRLLMRCEERSIKRAKLNDSVRHAYVQIAEAKMLLFAKYGMSSSVEFSDSVKFGKSDLESSSSSSDEDEENNNKSNEGKNEMKKSNSSKKTKKRVSREALIKVDIDEKSGALTLIKKNNKSENDDEKQQSSVLNLSDEERALKILSKESLKAIQDAFREIIVRAVDLGQT